VTTEPDHSDPFRPAAPSSSDETTWVPAPASAGVPPVATSDPFAGQHLQPVTPTSPVPAGRPMGRSSGAGLLVNVLLGIALVVAVGGVAFAAGRATAPTTAAANGNGGRFGNGGPIIGGPNASGAPTGNGGFVGNGGFLGGGGVSIEGTVTAVSADSITLQLANGQSVTIPIDAATTYHSRQAATAADVTTGSTVQVQLQGGRGIFNGNGNGNGNNGNGNGNGGPTASGQPPRTLPAAGSITLIPAGS
jgi:hypothetical protein